MAGVGSRTRSNNRSIFMSFSLDGRRSESKRDVIFSVERNNTREREGVSVSSTGGECEGAAKGKTGSGSREGEGVSVSVSGGKRKRESFVGDEKIDAITIDLSDDDDDDEEGVEGHCEKKGFESVFDNVKNEEMSEKGDKGANFGDNNNLGLKPENPITIDFDDSDEEEHGVEESSGGDDEEEEEEEDDDEEDESESEDNETSDEDFIGDDEGSESCSSEDSSTSYEDEDDEEDWRGYSKERRSKSSGVCTEYGENERRRYKRVVEEGGLENTPSSVNNDEWKHGDCSSVTSRACEMKGSSNSKLNEEVEKKQEEKGKRMVVENVSDDDDDDDGAVVVGGYHKSSSEGGAQKGKKKKDSFIRGNNTQSVPVMEETGDSTMVNLAEHEIMENKRRWHKDGIKTNNHEKAARVDDKTGDKEVLLHHKVRRMPFRRKQLRLLELLAECYIGKKNSMKGDTNGLKEKNGGDVHKLETPPRGETLPSIWSLKKDEPPVQKSKEEEELETLWSEMDKLIAEEQMDSLVGKVITNEDMQNLGCPNPHCKHDIYLDLEIGYYCRFCGWVSVEIRDISPPVLNRSPYEGSGRRLSAGGGADASLLDEDHFNVCGGDSDSDPVFSHKEGTVWDLIPDIKQSLYPHQQQGIEFIWKNLAGSIDLHKLKRADPCREGGCIISHAPGTGKTRLTMVFLQTYLRVFPKCLPVIVAPASLLLTWEDEFKKWDIGVPFHNLNNPELSGKEHADATNVVDWCKSQKQNKDAMRMVKLCSWFKERSILGISYSLYEILAGEKSQDEKKTRKKNGSLRKQNGRDNNENGVMGKVLREVPGLLVLDEGHTPRNQRSSIWKVLSEIQTRKRIILSGTPFQNNFLELYNTLSLVKPSFPNMIPPELKKFFQNRLMQENKASKEVSWEPVSSGNPADDKINQLKSLMDSFVHVHKGNILQKNLPGLRDCVLVLKLDSLQREILESIECSQNTLNFEHKLALVSVHPSLFLCCSLSEKEESVVDKEQLEKLRLNYYGGVKTRFLVEFVRLCDTLNERVLVFSQFIDPLDLIIDQLKSFLNWSEGKEVLSMRGKLDQQHKQFLIHHFNDANSQAKIMLASTKACSEGINLVGASRVVLLDVVWNPSVERQAISRAYRLGQKKVVYTYHLLTQGTTECTKYCKQAKKDQLSEKVFSARNSGEDNKPMSCAGDLEDKVLDLMVRHEKLKDMFVKYIVQPKERDLFEGFGS